MTLVILIVLLLMDTLMESKSVNGKIYTFSVPEKNLTTRIIQDKQADFGGDIPDFGIVGILQLARPLNACSPVMNVPLSMLDSYSVFALVVESDDQKTCPYSKQVVNCQEAGFHAVVVYDKEYSGKLKTMKASGGMTPVIPSVYISKYSGEELKGYAIPGKPTVQIFPNPELPLQLYLIPFAVVVGVCFFFMVIFSIFRFVRYRIRQRRLRLSPSSLKKIPTKKFKKGDDYDVCAICLDEYEQGEKIRILPCNHAYHCKCVDPWLLSGKKLCPVCKQNVEPKKPHRIHAVDGGSTSSYTDDTEAGSFEDENENSEDSENDEDERTPLLTSQHSPGARNV